MNVFGVNGSGRTGGNTSVLVNALLEGAAEAGAQTHLIELGELSIAPCDSCKACKKTHRCIISDDMDRFYTLAPETDVLILTTPIYLDHVSAQIMTFIQRTYCYLGLTLENYWPRKNVRAVLGITQGASNPEAYDPVLDWMADRLTKYYDIPTIARFTVASTRYQPVITPDHPEIQRAHAFGMTLRD